MIWRATSEFDGGNQASMKAQLSILNDPEQTNIFERLRSGSKFYVWH